MQLGEIETGHRKIVVCHIADEPLDPVGQIGGASIVSCICAVLLHDRLLQELGGERRRDFLLKMPLKLDDGRLAA